MSKEIPQSVEVVDSNKNEFLARLLDLVISEIRRLGVSLSEDSVRTVWEQWAVQVRSGQQTAVDILLEEFHFTRDEIDPLGAFKNNLQKAVSLHPEKVAD